MKDNINIENIDNDIIVSEILKQVIGELKVHEIKEIKKEIVKGFKDGEIIQGIIITVVGGSVMELLKYLVVKFKNRPNYNSKAKIKVNNLELYLEDVEFKEIQIISDNSGKLDLRIDKR